MKKLGYISLFAAVMLLGACNNYEDFDFNEVENGGYVDPAGSGTDIMFRKHCSNRMMNLHG